MAAGDASRPSWVCVNCGQMLGPYDEYLQCSAFPRDHRKQHQARRMTAVEVVAADGVRLWCGQTLPGFYSPTAKES